MVGLGGHPHSVSGAAQPSPQCVPAMDLALSDGAAGFPTDCGARSVRMRKGGGRDRGSIPMMMRKNDILMWMTALLQMKGLLLTASADGTGPPDPAQALAPL